MATARARTVSRGRTASLPPVLPAMHSDIEARYSLATQAVAEGIYDWDIARNALWVSPRLIEIFGFAGSSLNADDWNRLVHPEDFTAYRAAMRDCFKGVTTRLHCEYRVRHSDGGYRWIEDSALPVRDDKGWSVRLVGAVSDVTERKESERALRDALDQLSRHEAELNERTRDLEEALTYQTATSDVLKVISRSSFALEPMLATVAETAARLCAGDMALIYRRDGEVYELAASFGFSAEDKEFIAFVEHHAIEPGRGTLVGLTALQGEVVHVGDISSLPRPHLQQRQIASGDAVWLEALQRRNLRTMLGVPLLREGEPVGVIAIARGIVRPFTAKQIELVTTFADQAVIAIENARLITETREALEQQTATAEVLGVINSSPGDLVPVFDAILEKARMLCDAAHGDLWTYEGEFVHLAATHGAPGFARWLRQQGPVPVWPGSPTEQLVRGEDHVQFDDVSQDESFRLVPALLEQIKLAGIQTTLFVPLRKEDTLLGVVIVYRLEARRFTEKQIGLLRNFAAQAVIAMENARLITETHEALEKQTATAEILRVISQSPTDAQPTFDAIAASAARLCGAASGGVFRFDGSLIHLVAQSGYTPAELEAIRTVFPLPPGRGSATARAILTRALVHIPDSRVDPDFSHASLHQFGTVLSIPMLRDGNPLGAITVTRQQVEPFSEAQIELLQTFADQAVIAIENVRLFNETREALEQQTATAEVLGVINSSPGDLAPVFDAILEKATSLCEAIFGVLLRYDGQHLHAVALRNVPSGLAEFLRQPVPAGAGTISGQLVAGKPFVRIGDIAADEYAENPVRRAMIDLGGARSGIAMALCKDEVLQGAIWIYRQEARPFSDKQIALLQNFAAQAVIAMENARLLGELRQRTSALEEALEYQTATSEVLKVIGGAAGELQRVLDTVVDTSARVCAAGQVAIILRSPEDGLYRFAASFGFSGQFQEVAGRSAIPATRGSLTGRTLVEGRIVHIEDVLADPEYTWAEAQRAGGSRTGLGVPLLRDGAVIGVLGVTRSRVEPFTDKQIELVGTFADQAVIAIENTRLLTELRESLEQQTATAELLQVINSSPGDLGPVFDAILEKATRLCDARFGVLSIYEGEDRHRVVAMRDIPQPGAELLREPVYLGPETGMGRLVRGERFVHIVDAADDADYRLGNPVRRMLLDVAGARTYLAMPLRKDGSVLGAFTIYRREVRPFSDKQIALLQSFAAQAVIAMDNARLLDEIRRRQAELSVTFDNMGDGVAMFDGELRLAAWNRNFQEILDLPDAVVAAPQTFESYLRYLAGRGEFGEIDIETELRRYYENVDRHYSFERTRPDGHVIEVRHNPVPGGGFVLIYSDITERKRAEAEIRTARDAAEAALRELQAAQTNLIHAQKMAALGQLTAGIAHEIKNPLNFVNNFAGLSVELLDELKETAEPGLAALDLDKQAEIEETLQLLTGNLEKIAEHGRRADGIVKSMLLHSRGGSGDWQSVDLNGLIDEALNLAYHGARAQDQGFNIKMEREFDRNLAPLEVVPQDITRVFLNLFGNGFYAAAKRSREAGSRPVLTVTTRDLGQEVEIRVRDNGTGIAREHRDRLFQPFFTTKPTGEGTGLGLSISYDIVTQQHRGTIEVDSAVGEFTEFTVRLPRRGNGAGAGRAA